MMLVMVSDFFTNKFQAKFSLDLSHASESEICCLGI